MTDNKKWLETVVKEFDEAIHILAKDYKNEPTREASQSTRTATSTTEESNSDRRGDNQ